MVFPWFSHGFPAISLLPGHIATAGRNDTFGTCSSCLKVRAERGPRQNGNKIRSHCQIYNIYIYIYIFIVCVYVYMYMCIYIYTCIVFYIYSIYNIYSIYSVYNIYSIYRIDGIIKEIWYTISIIYLSYLQRTSIINLLINRNDL